MTCGNTPSLSWTIMDEYSKICGLLTVYTQYIIGTQIQQQCNQCIYWSTLRGTLVYTDTYTRVH